MSMFDLFNKKTVANPVESRNNDPQGNVASDQASVNSSINGKRRVYNLILLDESGSMQSIYKAAFTGVNETLSTIRSAQQEHADQDHFVSLITFDSTHYNEIYRRTSSDKASNITPDQYRPNACTPLYDAIGRSINELRNFIDVNDVVLATIITDGYENASREYDGKAIKALVETMKTQGWVFTYIGANQDVEAVAESMSIDNHLEFEATLSGATDMFAKEMRCRKKFFDKLSTNTSFDDISLDYFE